MTLMETDDTPVHLTRLPNVQACSINEAAVP